MPGRPYRRCQRPGCPNRTRAEFCTRHSQRARPTGFYKSSAWRKKRADYLASVGYRCERCGGIADTVHHRDPHGEDLNDANLEALCRGCHNRAHPEKSPGHVGRR